MSFLDSEQGAKLFEQYLKKFEGGSRRVYRSEVQQFFAFKGSGLSDINKDILNAYRDAIARPSRGTKTSSSERSGTSSVGIRRRDRARPC